VISGIAALLFGLALLTASADRTVLSAARISVHYGMSPVLVGAVVIGFGTSIPELVVSIVAGNPTEAMGNVVGSNVSNLTLVLGTAAVVGSIAASRSLILREGLVMGGAVVALALALANETIGRAEGVVLGVAAVAAYVVLVRLTRGQPVAPLDDYRQSVLSLELVMAPLALAITVGGAWLLVWGAETVADELGLTGAFVGLILLAVGTSLPELATAIAAARRREPDLVVGNVLGSNVFNSLVVGSAVGLVHPGTVEGLGPATVLMVAVTAVAGYMLLRSARLNLVHATLLLGGFVGLVVTSL
jgi:cation:H+ antiporter